MQYPLANNITGLKYRRVFEEMKISLERLQLPKVDIFYLHAPDHDTPVEETLSAVQRLYEGHYIIICALISC